jgi:uncharacterized protein
MQSGKPAGARCVQLADTDRCRLFGHPERLAVCAALRPGSPMGGETDAQTVRCLGRLKRQTQPARGATTSKDRATTTLSQPS